MTSLSVVPSQTVSSLRSSRLPVHFMRAKGYSWLTIGSGPHLTFVRADITLPSVPSSQREMLPSLVSAAIAEEHGGAVVESRTAFAIDDVRNSSSFRCTDHGTPRRRIPVPYAQMMDRAKQNFFLDSIRQGAEPGELIASLPLHPGHQDFLMHVFGCGEYSCACVSCQTLIEEWRAIKLSLEDRTHYTFLSYESSLRFPAV